jgi:hypothetical protein
LLLLIALTPALTLGLGIILFVLCLPCILKQLVTIMRDRRQREELGQRVVQGLAKRSFNPEVFKSQKDCAICLMEFEKDD